ncbi:hypothetical protein Leryth_000112 [Lithospermum erythrorhizon]|nr:hypothetical protein Leryth_000112 [Lithospermum erythrorhizon]
MGSTCLSYDRIGGPCDRKSSGPWSVEGKKVTILNMTINVPSTILISLIKDIGRDWDIDYEIGMKITADFPVIRNFTIPIS